MKYQQAKTEIKDLQSEFQMERDDMLDSIRELNKQLKLKDFIIQHFIPPKVSPLLFLRKVTETIHDHKYALMFDDVKNGGRAVWDEEQENWTIPKAKYSGNKLSTINIIQESKQHEKKYKNVLTLDLDIPERTTQDYEGPHTISRVADILNMGIDDDCDDVWPSKSPYLRYKDVSLIYSLDYD